MAQRAVLEVVHANPDGLTADALAERIHGGRPTAAQLESVRRAIRTLAASGRIGRVTRFEPDRGDRSGA